LIRLTRAQAGMQALASLQISSPCIVWCRVIDLEKCILLCSP